MFKKGFILFFALLLSINGIGQSADNLKAINEVWRKFCKSFETLDYELFAEIHSQDLIRISGGKRIKAYDAYIEGYKSHFTKAKKANETKAISLRFFERINNDKIASERGFYKSVSNPETPNERISYGQFHALLQNENGTWKILMDYDSDNGGTVSSADFESANALEDIDPFVLKPKSK
ncbi:MAG: nuclear transport factor 2 family protein [Saprospiraceae bacterium]|nr:nuclear transport factor 2 family protein [Saprospiraceae bacterium]